MKVSVLRSVSLIALSSAALSAIAQTAAVTSISGGSSFPAFNGTNQTIGWSFTVNTAFSVTALGFLDPTTSTPLSQSHQVGLWDSAGNLLASTVVGTNDPLTGGFRYSALASALTLGVGTYRIGAAITSPFGDVYTIPSTATTDSRLTITGAARNASSGGFSDPSVVTAGTGRFGPNMLIVNAPTVPGPMAALPFALLAIKRRKRA